MSTRKIVYTGLFAALGVVIPQLLHMIAPGMGQVFLPMHYPTIIAAMLLGPASGLIVALVSIFVGMSLGMPTFLPAGVFMIFELSTYGLVMGLLYNKKKLPSYVSLIITMVAGRIVYIAGIQIALRLFAVKLPPIFGSIAMFAGSIPGMIIQLIIIPTLIIVLERAFNNSQRLAVE